MVKVPKLGASSSSLSAYVHKSERVKAPIVLSSRSHSGSAAEVEGPSSGAVEQPLAIAPISVWNQPTKRVRSPSRMAEEARRKDPESKIGGDGDSLLHNAELVAGAVSSILKDSDLKRSVTLPVDEDLALSLQGVASVSSRTLSYLIPFQLGFDLALDVDSMLGVQVATHLKVLARKAKLNEGHAKTAGDYKARVASLTSERAELRGQMQCMIEEAVKLRYDLKHTTPARALAEGREDEARNNLRMAKGEL